MSPSLRQKSWIAMAVRKSRHGAMDKVLIIGGPGYKALAAV
jgi:hypothetical protein